MAKTGGFVVLGLGAFGKNVALALAAARQEVIVVDRDDQLVAEINEAVSEALIGDVTNRELLKEIQIQEARAAVVCVGRSLESSILATLACKDLGCARVVAKAVTREHMEILERIGADEVVLPEHMMAHQLAQQLVNPSVLDRLVLGPGYSVIRTPVPESWVGQTLSGLDVRRQHKVAVIAIETPKEDGSTELSASLDPERVLLQGEVLSVLGRDQDLQRMQAIS